MDSNIQNKLLSEKPISQNEENFKVQRSEKKYWFIDEGGEYLRNTAERMAGLSATGWRIMRYWRPISWQGQIIKAIFPVLFFVPFIFIISGKITKTTGIIYALLILFIVIGIFVVYYTKVDKSITKELEKLEKNHLTPISNVKDSILMLIIALSIVGFVVYKLNMF